MNAVDWMPWDVIVFEGERLTGGRPCCFSGCSETQASPGLSVRFASMCCFSWLVRISQHESREEPQRNTALHQRPHWKTQQEPLGGSEVSLPVSSPCRVIIGPPLSLFPFVTGASQPNQCLYNVAVRLCEKDRRGRRLRSHMWRTAQCQCLR